MQNQDFNDDKEDAREIGAGHSVTALYEIIPAGIESDVKIPSIDDLKYQKPNITANLINTNELMQVKLRYKDPNSATSQLITRSILDQNTSLQAASPNLRFSSAVAMFGMVLRNSEYKGQANFDRVLQLANPAKGDDLLQQISL
ncbi:YfbK domain-containing protein [Phormidesmis priestleyi]